MPDDEDCESLDDDEVGGKEGGEKDEDDDDFPAIVKALRRTGIPV